jgi:hypothetical protein
MEFRARRTAGNDLVVFTPLPAAAPNSSAKADIAFS